LNAKNCFAEALKNKTKALTIVEMIKLPHNGKNTYFY